MANILIERNLNLNKILKNKSIFIFGPRQTGKTTFLKTSFQDAKTYSLLKSDIYLRLLKDPSLIRNELELIEGNIPLIIIDEIQKLPSLLDEVQELIDSKNVKFVLTGSSARKLKKQGVNLLGGRATWLNFNSFNFIELGNNFDLLRVLQFGTLPPVYLSKNPSSYLKDYVDLYLREEIMAEGLVRKLPAFSRFLEVAALCNGQMLNYTKIANDAQVPKTTTYEYFQILKDTLIAYELNSYKETKKRKAIQASKFYFFDSGVVRYLQGRASLNFNSEDFGSCFEAFIFHELKSYTDNNFLKDLCYFRSCSGYEVDFILDNRVAIEVKSTKKVSKSDLKGLFALKEENLIEKYILVSLDEINQKIDGVFCYYYKDFLIKLWDKAF